MSNDILLTTTWARAPLGAQTPQVGYLLVEARPQLPVAAGATTPINFCMVLDRSGSMDGAKMDHLKKAVQTVIEDLKPTDIVSVIVFDEVAETMVPATPADNKVALNNRVEAIRVQGGTAMSTGLEAGLTEIQKHAADRPSTLLLLTDGQTWGDEDRCRELAQALAQAGVRITALGLGDEWNEQLLDGLAGVTGGNADYIADPTKLSGYFQRAATTAQTTAVRNARLTLRLAQGVQPRAIYRVTPLIANLGYKPIGEREINVEIGDIQSDVGGSVLAELMLPARAVGQYRVAQAEIVYDIPTAQQLDQRVRHDVMIEFTADPAAVKPDPRSMNLVEKVTAFKLQTRALDEAAAGNMVGATQKLRSAATRLLDMGELDLAATMNRAADSMATGSGPSAADQKQMTYATRRLTLTELTGEK